MERILLPARPDYEARLRNAGCTFPTMYGAPYMAETLPEPAAYRLTPEEVARIAAATREVHTIALAVAEHACTNEAGMVTLGIPEEWRETVAASWKRGDQDLYQRLDLCLDARDGNYKLFEVNGDTPTGVVEMNCNLLWLQDMVDLGYLAQGTDVFNDVRYHLTERFGQLRIRNAVLYFASITESDEERDTVRFMEACAQEAGLHTAYVPLDDIGMTEDGDMADPDNLLIEAMFMLSPWEEMMAGPNGEKLRRNTTCRLFEPAWKMCWSNKAFLALAWELFPGHPNLLPAYVEGNPQAKRLRNVIRKPQWGREGQNMTITRKGKVVAANGGDYAQDVMILQEHIQMPCFDGRYPILGSWIIDGQPAGLLIREDSNPITGNLSACLPTFTA